MSKVKAVATWLTKWFTAIVLVWAVFNYFVPNTSLWAKSYTGYLLSIVLFGMGLTLSVDDFVRTAKQGYFPKCVYRIGVSLVCFYLPAHPFRMNRYESSHGCTGLIALS